MIWLFYLIPVIGIVVFGYFTIREFKKYGKISKTGIKTEGTVSKVDTEYAGNEDGDRTSAADIYISYETRSGKKYETMLDTFFRFGFRKKEKITIYYNPDNPREITPSGTWLAVRFAILWILFIPFILIITAILIMMFSVFR